ncbi:hypothetical protein D3C72_2417380 [compost metagenome]
MTDSVRDCDFPLVTDTVSVIVAAPSLVPEMELLMLLDGLVGTGEVIVKGSTSEWTGGSRSHFHEASLSTKE